MDEKNEDYIIVEPSPDRFKGNAIDFDNPPKVSFCIPTLNNEDTLDRCLSSMTHQEYPDIEIIIVDGYSKDKTIEIAKKYTDKIYFDNGTLGSARQTSIEHSSGEILALFDSDIIIPHRTWLINAMKYFNYSNKVSTVWPLNVAPTDSPMTTRLYFNHWKVVIEDRIKKKRSLYGGGNALFLRNCIEEIGGIDKSLHWGEDFDWAQKLKDLGYQVVFIRDPLYHDTMRSLRQFARKQFAGAKTFTRTGFQLMNLSAKDVFYEQVVLGTKGMIKGLVTDKDVSWLLFPLFMFIRVVAYMYTYVRGLKRDKGVDNVRQ
ncbi:Glycosyltransferase involved in cell wall bisynthesis [Candidatus Methanophagaceae archaeon]|nr:Glycosyltransferase involved in cell wall bisynthesis [Methanophagales archaeon]